MAKERAFPLRAPVMVLRGLKCGISDMVWSELTQSAGGGAAAVRSARFRRGPSAERQLCGCLLHARALNSCLHLYRAQLLVFFLTSLGDYIGLPGERVSTAASLSTSSKFCVYSQGEQMID